VRQTTKVQTKNIQSQIKCTNSFQQNSAIQICENTTKAPCFFVVVVVGEGWGGGGGVIIVPQL
jgi:hypothetical protein